MKDAILIITHKSDLTLKNTLKILDSNYFDIYIHVDKKVSNFDFDSIKNICKKSKIYFVNRLDVRWGAFSLVKAELELLKESVNKNNYRYYHLISGDDLPLKSSKYIYDFFSDNNGKEFVVFQSDKFNYSDRIDYYYFFQEKLIRNKITIYNVFNKGLVTLQKIFRFKRNHIYFKKFKKGSEWFSITNDLAKYIVSLEDKIIKDFDKSFCSDEVFLQTIVYNSKFKNKLYYKKYDNNPKGNMRLIDWNRGKPYVFKENDYQELIDSEMLFARKFDSINDPKIITKIYRNIKKQ